MNETSIFHKELNVGQWHLQIPPTRNVLRVFIRGLRNRKSPLRKLDSKDEYMSYVMKTPDGKINDQGVMRGTPNSWWQEKNVLWIYPSPAHRWNIEVESEARA